MIYTTSPEDRSILEDLQRDADRYRFLRDEDNWVPNNREIGWSMLRDATEGEFDDIVDARMDEVEE